MPVIECRAAPLEQFAHAAELRQAMERGFDSDFDAQSGGWREKFCEYFGGKQRAGRGQLYLAFDGPAPIGMAIVTLTDEWRSFVFGMRFAFVNAVFVKPEYRRRGIGRDLMLCAIAWAKEKKCARIRLRTSEEGRALYESVGFRPGREMELNF